MNKVKKLLAVAITLTILFSSLPLYANALGTADLNSKIEENNNKTNFYGKTGDLGVYEEDTTTQVIESVEDYLNITNQTDGNKKAVAATGVSSLPSSVDNSQSPYFPEIGDQGSLGACVVFATTHYQFTYTMNKARGVVTTPDNTFSVKWVYNMINYGIDSGSTAYSIYNFLKQSGCPFAKSFPYDGVDFTGWSCDEKVWREAMRYRLKDSQSFIDIGKNSKGTAITSNDDTDLELIKTALNNGDILKFSSFIYSWEYDKIKPHNDAPENNKYIDEEYVRLLSGAEGGHGMAIVGYNDDIWCDINCNNNIDSGEMGAFKIANSWGKGYGNDGFMWIAYDALNEISCVDGVEHIITRPSCISEVYRIDVCDSYEGNDFYLKFTLNTADRSQFLVTFNADKNGTEYKNYFLSGSWHASSSNNFAFNGTKNACDATFVYPLNDLSPDISPENFEEYNFSATFKDSKKDSVPLIVKNVSLVNEYTGREYKVNNNFPVTVDGSEYTINIKDTTKSNAVIYYIGYDNPKLHYKTSGSDFTKVEMEENDEHRGALYKYVIKDVTGDVTLYFSDGNGKTDNNQGKYYSAKAGRNYYYTKNQREPLTISDIYMANGTPDVGKRCLPAVKITGGYEPYQYSYIIENLNTGERKIYDYDYNYEISPYGFSQEGTYQITVEAMDYAKDTTVFSKEFEVVNHPFLIESITLDKEPVFVSKNVQFASTTAFEGIASYGGYRAESRFLIKDSSGKVWRDEIVKYSTYDTKIKTTTTLYDFIPYKSGEYTLNVSSDDCNNEYAEKTISFTVYDMIYGDADGNTDINIMDATIIQQYLANIIKEENIYTDMADCDGNTDVNIMDATRIQLYLAKKENSGSVGNVIEFIPPTEPETEAPTVAPTQKPTTAPASNKVTFTNSLNWSGTIYCYYWSDENTTMTSWPGKAMTNAGTNEFSQALYTFDVPNGADHLIFTNGSAQTVDIKYSGGDVRYYALDTKTGNGHNVETW
ncbi:MAG: starch-binding protein [Ruminococcus sp.]|nr:starch-binding protein [Ruminococcus sp.]